MYSRRTTDLITEIRQNLRWLLNDVNSELAKPFYVRFLTSKKGTLSLNESFECIKTMNNFKKEVQPQKKINAKFRQFFLALDRRRFY